MRATRNRTTKTWRMREGTILAVCAAAGIPAEAGTGDWEATVIVTLPTSGGGERYGVDSLGGLSDLLHASAGCVATDRATKLTGVR